MIIDDLAIGTVSGTAASGPMTMFMELAHRAMPHHERDPLPPRLITERLSHHAGLLHKMGEKHRFTLTILAHFAYGGGAGALYAPLAGRLKTPAIPGGILFGLLVWASSYLGLLPALGLYPSPRKDSHRRTLIMVVAHVIWGAALGSLVQLLQKSQDDAASMAGSGLMRKTLARLH